MKNFRLAHISDPHFGTTTPEKIAALTTALRNLNPNIIALSGDITQRARSAQFVEAKKFCEGLTDLKILAAPGNHDIPLFNLVARAFTPFEGYLKILGFPLSAKFTSGPAEVLALNSTHPLRHVQGALDENEISKVKSFSETSTIRIVMFHHPMDCRLQSDEKNLLKNADESLAEFENSKVDLVLAGHIHDPLIRLSNHRYPWVKRPCVISTAGTCLSSRTRSNSPNSFHLFEFQDEGEAMKLKASRYNLSENTQFLKDHLVEFKRTGDLGWQPNNN